MKTLCIRVGFILPALLTAGCCPNGCFVLSGDAYQKLANPKPPRDEWEMTNHSLAQRNGDWIACGGSEIGGFSPPLDELISERRQGEYGDIPAHRRLYDKVLFCMMAKGYHYTGKCYVTEISKAYPACGAP